MTNIELHQPVRPPSRTQWRTSKESPISTGSPGLDQLETLIERRLFEISQREFADKFENLETHAKLLNPGLQFATDMINQNQDVFDALIRPYRDRLHSTHGVVLHTWEDEKQDKPYKGLILGQDYVVDYSPRALRGLALSIISSDKPLTYGIQRHYDSFPYSLERIQGAFNFMSNYHIIGIGPYAWSDRFHNTSGESICAWKVYDLFLVKQLTYYGLTEFTDTEARQSFFRLQEAL